MSAFMCSENHINTIVTFACQRRIDAYVDGLHFNAGADPQKWVDVLTKANRDSLEVRYGDTFPEPIPKFKKHRPETTPVEIVKLCQSFEYQACEVDDYKSTKAHRFIEAVLYEILTTMDGYDDAAWSI